MGEPMPDRVPGVNDGVLTGDAWGVGLMLGVTVERVRAIRRNGQIGPRTARWAVYWMRRRAGEQRDHGWVPDEAWLRQAFADLGFDPADVFHPEGGAA